MTTRTLMALSLAGAVTMTAACASKPNAVAPVASVPPAVDVDESLMLAVQAGDTVTGAWAAPAAATPATPATQPAASADRNATPPGHPPMGGAMGGARGGMSKIPPGHPPMPGQPQPQGGMPPGHPDLAQMRAAQQQQQGAAPTSQPAVAATSGTLTIKALQSTDGGPAVGAEKFVLELYRPDAEVERIDLQFGPNGIIEIDGLPLGEGVQPVAKVTYGGVEYVGAGQVMGPTSATQELVVPVYETTDEEPDWQVRARHVMAQPVHGLLHVMEVVAVENPADRAWVGVADASGKRTTFAWPLPAGAQDVQLTGGFHDCCTVIANDRIVNTMAVVPGSTQYQFSYTLPIDPAKPVVLPITAPVGTDMLLAVVPDDGSTVAADGLELSGTREMKMGVSRIYRATGVEAGRPVTLTISGFPAAALEPPPAQAAPAGAAIGGVPSSQAGKVIAGIGGLGILLIGGGLLFARGGKATARKDPAVPTA